MTRIFRILTLAAFIICVLGIAALIVIPAFFKTKKSPIDDYGRVIIPRSLNARAGDLISQAELMAREDNMASWAPMEEGEVIVSVITGYFDGGPAEKQFIAYRNLLEVESPIYIAYINFDETSRTYKRYWSAPTAASRPATARLYTQDLLGDRSVCVLLSGMNSNEEHTLTVFHRQRRGPEPFLKIAEISMDGTISVRETERTQAYQSGQSRGQPFSISVFGRDHESSNILDQIEIVYAYNEESGLYEETGITRIPGSQIEQRRVRELLGNRELFEDFITGLWYHITPQGTISRDQYIYFNPPGREIIFYSDEIQQVFNWQNSTATRYGLYLSSQNISVTTLRRSIDIELESLESIKVRVIEDVRLKIGVNAPWDGSYRKMLPLENKGTKDGTIKPHIEANYEGPVWKIRFQEDGSYELTSGDSVEQGKYTFYKLYEKELLELRPKGLSAAQRDIYLIEGEKGGENPKANLSLVRARIGSRGIETSRERAISLTLASE